MASARERATRRMKWLVINLRWLFILLAALVLFALPPALPEATHRVTLLLLSIIALYQVGLTLLEFFEYWPGFLPWLSALADVVLTVSLFAVADQASGRLIWIGLLPAMPVALRRGWAAGFLVIVIVTLLQGGLLWYLRPDDLAALLTLGLLSFILWPTPIVSAAIANRLRRFIHAALQDEQRQEALRSQILREHARTVYEMSSIVSATFDYEKVLEAALNFGVRGAESSRGNNNAQQMVCAVLVFEEDQLRVKSARRFPTADERKMCPGREGVLGQVIRTGDLTVIEEPGKDPELKQFVGFQNCHALIALPLRAGFETYGVVLYGHPDPNFFDQDQRALLAAVVNQANIAMQNAQLYRNLRAEKERLVEVQEEAQKKLARDLHDGPTQAVAALAMRSNFVRRLIERDPKTATEELFKMEDLARRTTKEIRHMLFTLRPLVLENQGLIAALNQLAEKMHETHSQNVIVEAEAGVDEPLEKNHQGVLFYIVEEAVNNARKHAQAEHIWVRLKIQRDVLVTEIQDDGVGFNLGAVDANYDKRGSLGMVNMRERAEMLGGTVKIVSAEGKGTRISVFAPLTEEARDRMRM